MIIDLFVSLITAIKETVERLIGYRDGAIVGKPSRPTNLAFAAASTKDSSSHGGGVSGKKMLIALCNVDYILQYSLITVCQRLADNGVKHTDQLLQVYHFESISLSKWNKHDRLYSPFQQCRQTLVAFRGSLIKAYYAVKCAPFASLIDPIVYSDIVHVEGICQWVLCLIIREICTRLTSSNIFSDVSNFVKDLVLCIVFVQAELQLIAAHFSSQVMSLVVRACIDRLALRFDAMESITRFTIPAATQAVLDVAALEESVSAHLTLETR